MSEIMTWKVTSEKEKKASMNKSKVSGKQRMYPANVDWFHSDYSTKTHAGRKGRQICSC